MQRNIMNGSARHRSGLSLLSRFSPPSSPVLPFSLALFPNTSFLHHLHDAICHDLCKVCIIVLHSSSRHTARRGRVAFRAVGGSLFFVTRPPLSPQVDGPEPGEDDGAQALPGTSPPRCAGFGFDGAEQWKGRKGAGCVGEAGESMVARWTLAKRGEGG
jgi:hypothetical protein